MSMFDAQSFLDATIETALEKREPLPATQDYNAVIGEIVAKEWQGKADPTKSGILYEVPLAIDVPPDLQESGGLPPTINLKDSIMLDITPGGSIDLGKGKNNKLRQYREALDMNKPGEPFTARAMQGRVIKVRIKHEEYQGNLQERVNGVAKA